MLPEVFGLNAWVRSVADRLAAHGTAALAVPLFARSAPDLDLGYKESDLAQGRRHKNATTTLQILSDLSVAITWLKHRCPKAAIDVVGFCFGGHAALLAATLPEVRRSFDFYGAGVSTMRPGGGSPSLDPDGERLRYLEMPDADHGFMCEDRSSFNPEASARGWTLLLET